MKKSMTWRRDLEFWYLLTLTLKLNLGVEKKVLLRTFLSLNLEKNLQMPILKQSG